MFTSSNRSFFFPFVQIQNSIIKNSPVYNCLLRRLDMTPRRKDYLTSVASILIRTSDVTGMWLALKVNLQPLVARTHTHIPSRGMQTCVTRECIAVHHDVSDKHVELWISWLITHASRLFMPSHAYPFTYRPNETTLFDVTWFVVSFGTGNSTASVRVTPQRRERHILLLHASCRCQSTTLRGSRLIHLEES